MNLEAIDDLERTHSGLELLFVESGGDSCRPADPGGVPCRAGLGSVNLDAPPWTFTATKPPHAARRGVEEQLSFSETRSDKPSAAGRPSIPSRHTPECQVLRKPRSVRSGGVA